MFSRRSASARPQQLTALSFLNFTVLGLHVGVYAVQLAPLSTALELNPGRLGLALTCAALAGLVTLFGGGVLADKLGRRVVLLIGFLGTGTAFALLSLVHSYPALVGALVVYGLTVSFIDLGVNTVGSDLEAMTRRKVMTGLHAGFSAGAFLGALATALVLTAGVDFRDVYQGLAAVLIAAGIVAAVAALPVRPPHDEGHDTAEGGGKVWRIPAVLFAMALIGVTFFGEGALESFLAVYLQRALGSTILLTGVGVATYHAASLTGRLITTRVQHRWGERRVVTVAGLLASAGITITVLSTTTAAAIAGLLIVGFAVAPIVPAALSLAGRSAPHRAGQAVATTTAVGYAAFVISPSIVGGLATLTSLRVALALLILTTLTVALLGHRWPLQRSSRPTKAAIVD